MRRSLIASVLGLTLLAPLALGAYQPGDTIADFTLYDAYGVERSLYDYREDIILINWWRSS